MPCWVPERYRSIANEEKGPAVFIGSADVLRENLFSEAINAGAHFMVYGRGWIEGSETRLVGLEQSGGMLRNQYLHFRRHGFPGLASKLLDKAWSLPRRKIPVSQTGRTLNPEDYVRLTRESPVVLGVGRVPSPLRPLRYSMKYSRLRDIEAPMLGACYLTEHTEGVAALYELGKEVETYGSAEELAEKLRQLPMDAGKRRALRLAGQSKSLSAHSLPASMGKIAARLGLAPTREC